jgi:hypothetical protein
VLANNLNVSNVVVSRDATEDDRKKLLARRTEAKKIQLAVARKYKTNTHTDTIGKGQRVVKKELIVSNQ